MTAYRYYIWKNSKVVSDCQRLSTVHNRLLKLCRESDPAKDEIWVTDTETDVCYDASEFVPSFK